MTTTHPPSRIRIRPASCFRLTLLAASVLASTLPAVAAPFRVEEATIADIHAAILAKELTATELLELYLARIKAFNGPGVEEPEGVLGPVGKLIPHAPGINALSTLNLRPAARKSWGFGDRMARSMTDIADEASDMPDAFETAAKLDAHVATTGELIGPLHGVVMAIKDQYDTFDMRSTSGADAFYANDRPPHDAEFITRLRAAGAIILAKANLSEYADGTPRSSFGGTFVNPYDTQRNPGISSSGSGSSVAANLVTVAIAEETGSSIRGPAHMNNCVGIAPTQELVSRHGMIQMGINTRTGPIARTVEDAARVLSVIAGYDPKDPMTAFAVGRLPGKPYETFTQERSLKGMRIGVVREYMNKSLFTKADEENIDIVDRAIADLRKLGATVIDPGPQGELFTEHIRKLYPMLMNRSFTQQHPDIFPVDADGKPTSDHMSTLVELALDPSKAPGDLTLRGIAGRLLPGSSGDTGEGRYQMNLYLGQRGDTNLKSLTDLYTKANFHAHTILLPNRQSRLKSQDEARVLDTAVRMQRRFAVQQVILAAFAEMNLDAVVYPTSNLPPPKIGAPREPTLNGRSSVWSFLGQQGFPAITVPAGFTTRIYDRVPDPDKPVPPDASNDFGASTIPSIMLDPVAAQMPVGMDIVGRPFSEPTLLTIAAAYEQATHHRKQPPDFGPLPGDS